MKKIVVIGAGEVGRYFVQTLLKLQPTANITLLGNELPYDRISLVHILDGTYTPKDLETDSPCLIVHSTVKYIDRYSKTVFLLNGQSISYSVLVIATGAEPFMLPNSPQGVFPLRDMEHATQINTLVENVKNAVVIGAGALGVESAIALKKKCPHLNITILNATDRVLDRMLDSDASSYMLSRVKEDGIAVQNGAEAKGFLRNIDHSVVAVELKNGEQIPAEMVIVAIGVQAQDALAQFADLSCNRGIVVDKDSRTSDPAIFAIGDCTSQSTGLLTGGYLQAEAAARYIAGDEYAMEVPKTISINRLKTHHKVYSVGVQKAHKEIRFKHPHTFRKLFFDKDSSLVGAIVFGAWDELPNIEHAIVHGQIFSRARQAFFRHFGRMAFTSPSPEHWSNDASICQCKHITKGAIMHAKANCQTVDEIGKVTGAGTNCGGCKPIIALLLNKKPDPIRYAKTIGTFALMAAVLASLLFLFSIPYPGTFKSFFGPLYRNNLVKQISGFSLLALTVGLAVLGIRKRSSTNRGAYDTWKLIHAVLGVVVLAVLVAHSGGRFGGGLTFVLSISFLSTALSGALLGLVFSKKHEMKLKHQKMLSTCLHWLHIIYFWPLPVLLTFHVLQSYLWS